VNVLVFGANGQLGFELVKQSGAKGLGREACDITEPASVLNALEKYEPDVVFNAAAYNAVDRAESEADLALALNGVAPGQIARACRARGIQFVHFSTDYVFGNGHRSPIDETHVPLPLSVYGRTKYFGEQMVLQADPNALVIRTTGLYSTRGSNFLKTMIRLGRERDELSVVADQVVAPTRADTLASAALELVSNREFGLFHAVSSTGCTWYDFACAIFENAGLTPEVSKTTQAQWKAAAVRPDYSVLDNARLRIAGMDGFFGTWRAELDAFWEENGVSL